MSHRTIQCPFSFVISVISATWGYTTANVCGYKGNTKCQLNVTSTLRWKCEGLTHCIVRISREDFQPDPCVGVFKYLEVNYKCIEGGARSRGLVYRFLCGRVKKVKSVRKLISAGAYLRFL